MALENFIKTVWSNELLVSLKKAHIFGQPGIANRDYEGEIKSGGDTVKINAIGTVTVGDYVKNSDITSPQELTDAQATLEITQQKYFNFQVDDVDKVQGNPRVMGQAMQESAYALRNTADKFLAGLLVSGLSTASTLGTTSSPKTVTTATDAYDNLINLKTMLDMANVPDEGRWAIMPSFYQGAMLKDERFVHDSTVTSTTALLNGKVGRAAGFDILISNNIPFEGTGAVGDYYYVFAGTSLALSFAEQIVDVEAYRPEKRFADAVKGLHVYGGKVVRPEALVGMIVDRA